MCEIKFPLEMIHLQHTLLHLAHFWQTLLNTLLTTPQHTFNETCAQRPVIEHNQLELILRDC